MGSYIRSGYCSWAWPPGVGDLKGKGKGDNDDDNSNNDNDGDGDSVKVPVRAAIRLLIGAGVAGGAGGAGIVGGVGGAGVFKGSINSNIAAVESRVNGQ